MGTCTRRLILDWVELPIAAEDCRASKIRTTTICGACFTSRRSRAHFSRIELADGLLQANAQVSTQPGVDLGLVKASDQESVRRREYLAMRPNGTQRLDDRHQVIQGFEWITAGRRRHVRYTAIGGKRLSNLGRYAHCRISSSNASRLKSRKYSRISSIFSACRFAATRALMSSRSCVR